MLPTFNSGDWLLFRTLRNQTHSIYGAKVLGNLIGQVVLIERESELGSDFLQVKRVKKVSDEGIWVEGDNTERSTDSRTWGYLKPNEIKAVFVFRYKKA